MEIREANTAELEQCQAIYAYHVLHGTGSFEDVPPSLEALTERHTAITQAGAPWLVAADQAGVAGFGYYGPFRTRAAYRFTVEDSVYVRASGQGRGVGRAPPSALLTTATAQGHKEMLALIGDAENTGSIRLHAGLGFVQVGVMRRVGHKFGRWLDVVTMQKSL